ncbi:hypothetical protein KC19_2G088800 [Ceratodon purpureus]|uniref:HMA domain-containing protein n=1 Tax=Ceratodon purpureus TaxID=3225 RepID=A0A8T0IVL7_CERPU|nr:hypothetical protein KC19_2G088800 [Ceratodon purpureus]
MSKLVKLKLASKKSLSCFIPNCMATPGESTLFPTPEPEAPDDDVVKPNGVKTAEKGQKVPETKHEARADVPRPPENLERAMVAVESKEPKSKETSKPVEEEEVLELKTPGFIRLFGCDNCEESENDDRHKAHSASSDESMDDESSPRSSSHHSPYSIPVVHLRVPMKNEDDVRKVVAALQLRGVVEVACDLENQIVKVTGNADPDRLLKKVKKVKRKSKLISYTNPEEIPVPPQPSFHSDIPPPPPPPYGFHQPAYEERYRPPLHEPHGFTRESHGPYAPPPGHVRPNLRPSARPMHYDSEAFYHHHGPPPPASAFYRDESFYPDYMPSNLRPPSSPPHYSSTSFYHERSPPNLRHSTSPPRRRSYYHERSAPSFRPPPPPPMHYPGIPPSHHRSSPWGPGVPYDFQQVPDRMMHMYH